MTRDEISVGFWEIVQQQLSVRYNETLDDTKSKWTFAGDLGAHSLDMASIQIAVEDKFGLVFATSAKDFTEIDRAWEAMKTVGDGIGLIERFTSSR